MRLHISLLALGIAAACSGAQAMDTIYLKNGDEFGGTIVERAGGTITIKLESGGMRSVPERDVDVVVRAAEPVKPETKPEAKPEHRPESAEMPKESTKPTGEGNNPENGELKTVEGNKEGSKPAPHTGPTEGKVVEGGGTEGPAPVVAEGAKEGTEATKPQEPKKGIEPTDSKEEAKDKTDKGDKGKDDKDDPKKTLTERFVPKEFQEFCKDAFKRLDVEDPTERAAVKGEFVAKGPKIIPALVEGLNHRRSEARQACAEALGELRAQNATKWMIEAIFSAVPAKGRPLPWQVPFLRGLKDGLTAITGQAFITVEPSSAQIQDGIQKYIEWYNANFQFLPPQVGEAAIEPTDPDYVEKLKKARALVLAKKDYPVPPGSVDQAIGKEDELVPNGATAADKDKQFEKSIPKGERENAGGVMRESDKDFGKNFFNRP